MKAHTISSLLLLLGVAGCTQDPTTGTTTVSGQVVENQSRKPVGGATVQVYQTAKSGGYAPVSTTFQADGQGHFALSFEATSTSGYAVFAQAYPGYFTPAYAATGITAGRANKDVVVPMLAPAWVRLQLVDEPPKNNISIYTSGYEGPGDRLYYPGDTVLFRPLIAGFSGRINWSITDEKGINTHHYQTISVGALDTAKVRIPF
ncbi:MAG: hypothetical protein ACRYFX_22465 [Janthinobacterium lividum]